MAKTRIINYITNPEDSQGKNDGHFAEEGDLFLHRMIAKVVPKELRMHCRSVFKVAILLILSWAFSYADGTTVGRHNVGVAAGFVTGYGLSYRQWFNKNGIQVTFAPFYNKDSNETFYSMSLGITGLRNLLEAKVVNLFVYYGPHFWYSYDRTHYPYYLSSNPYSPYPTQTNISKRLFVGGGPGFDFYFWRMSFNLMFGLAYTTDLGNSSGVTFTGETGLYYSF